MKTKKDIFLEDVVNMGKDVIKNNLLIPPKDMERGHEFSTMVIDTLIGSSIGLYVASQHGDYRKLALGFLIGFAYGSFSPILVYTLRDIRDGIREYMNNLEERAKSSH